MGVAAMLIIVCHAYANGVGMSVPMQKITGLGGCGVDMFLFLSGMGLTCSLTGRNAIRVTETTIWQWYKKRYCRILTPYLIFAIPVYAIIADINNQCISKYLFNISTISYWLDGWGLWFVAMLLPLYLVAPLIIRLLTGDKRHLWFVILMVIFIFFALLPFPDDHIMSHVQFCANRLPGFLLGVYMWRAICIGSKISLWWSVGGSILAYIVLYVINHAWDIHFSLFWLTALPLLIISSLLVSKIRWLRYVSRFMGNISLESYCTNVFVPSLLMSIFNVRSSMFGYIASVCACILLSVIINRFADCLNHKFFKAI